MEYKTTRFFILNIQIFWFLASCAFCLEDIIIWWICFLNREEEADLYDWGLQGVHSLGCDGCCTEVQHSHYLLGLWLLRIARSGSILKANFNKHNSSLRKRHKSLCTESLYLRIHGLLWGGKKKSQMLLWCGGEMMGSGAGGVGPAHLRAVSASRVAATA